MGAFVVRKLLVAPESRMAQALMEVMWMLTVKRRGGGLSDFVISKVLIYCYQ